MTAHRYRPIRLPLLTTAALLAALSLPLATQAQPQTDGNQRPRAERTERAESDRGERDQRSDRAERRERLLRERAERTERVAPDDRPHRPERLNPERLNPEQLEEALATLRELHGDNPPAWIKRIERSIEDKPEEAARRLSHFPRIQELVEMRKNNPEAFALHVKQVGLSRDIVPLSIKLRRASAANNNQLADELREQLRERVRGVFEVRLEMKRQEIERQRTRLRAAEQELIELQNKSDELIEEKLQEIESRPLRRPRGGDAQPAQPD